MAYTYNYKMAAATSTMVLTHEGRVLLGKRKDNVDAFPGRWSLPGGFLNVGTEGLKAAAARETKEELDLAIEEKRFRMFYLTDNIGLDPRYEQIINACFIVELSDDEAANFEAGDDLDEAKWFTCDEVQNMDLPFDHNNIMRAAANIIRGLEYVNHYRLKAVASSTGRL